MASQGDKVHDHQTVQTRIYPTSHVGQHAQVSHMTFESRARDSKAD
jgi:hypothetical protein